MKQVCDIETVFSKGFVVAVAAIFGEILRIKKIEEEEGRDREGREEEEEEEGFKEGVEKCKDKEIVRGLVGES